MKEKEKEKGKEKARKDTVFRHACQDGFQAIASGANSAPTGEKHQTTLLGDQQMDQQFPMLLFLLSLLCCLMVPSLLWVE